jgi:hypothetical protein
VAFWGRINGIGADYLIAQGYKLPYAMVGATSSPAVSFYRYAGRFIAGSSCFCPRSSVTCTNPV